MFPSFCRRGGRQAIWKKAGMSGDQWNDRMALLVSILLYLYIPVFTIRLAGKKAVRGLYRHFHSVPIFPIIWYRH